MSNIPISVSRLGSVVFSNLIIEDLVINEVLLSVSNNKNIVMTDIAGRNGTVKEYINRGDYQIRVQGLIVDPVGNFFPTSRVKRLRAICELERDVLVSSAFLNHFNITNVVITDYSIAEDEGVRNAVPFTLTLVSETPIEIKVNA